MRLAPRPVVDSEPQHVLYWQARDFLRHIGLSPVCVPRQPVGSGYRALDPAGFMVLSEVETSLALIMGLESSGIPLCDSAWNKDPVFGVIGIQTGPRGQRVHNGFHDGHGSR